MAMMVAGACGGPKGAKKPPPPGVVVSSDVARELDPAVSPTAKARLIEDQHAFALDVYRELRASEENLFFSPFSVSLTLAMIYAGARGSTEAQMAQALHLGLSQQDLHPAYNWLESTLRRQARDSDGLRLHIVNASFGREGQELLPSYLDVLARSYGAGMALLDFTNRPEDARRAINDWVGKQTEDRIPDLLPQGSISPLTVLVLVNAVYFKAAWHTPFDAARTESGVFHAAGGDVTVPMMTGEPARASYVRGDDFQAVSLPYRGETFEMVVVMPDQGHFDEIENRLDAVRLSALLGWLRPARVAVTMPRFEIRTRATMNQILQTLGMRDAFTSAADFSGIDGQRDLYLSLVQHEAFVRVDEAGTEAAAATAGGIGLVSLPQPVIIDKPFLFLIRHVETGSILFLGRVIDPS
jgi:serpin B